MKTFFKPISIVIGLALSLSLSSCEKDSLLTPSPAGSARDDDLVVGIPQVHKLIKYGDATLTYADDGRLRKVTQAPVRGSLDVHTDYTYGPGSVRAISYKGLVVAHDETFTLDANGRCTESVEEGNKLYNGAYFHYTIHWIFT